MSPDPDIQDENERKKPKMSRITVGLDEFDYRVIGKMAKNRNIALSEATRMVVHNWIESSPAVLKTNYGVDIKEVTEEIALETMTESFDEIVKELPRIFELVEDISLNDLAEHLEIKVKAVKSLIFTHSEKIKKLGLSLRYRGDRIYKEIE